MAVQVRRGLPPDQRVLSGLMADPVENVLCPLAHGAGPGMGGEGGYFVICPAPPGPAITAGRPWPEGELLTQVLRPAALALEGLAARRLTHRAIRLGNMFRPAAGGPVVLGSLGTAPPGSLQPAVYEPPYSAQCLPSGRGAGCIADDVYALGVVLLFLALGQEALGQESRTAEAEMLRRKCELGSFAALAGDARLPGMLADILRGMLAEDPDHRPPPALLADPVAARARRVAARPQRRAQHPLEMNGTLTADARTLALAMTGAMMGAMAGGQGEAARLLRDGTVGAWLRRGLGDPALTARIDEALRQHAGDAMADEARADALLAMRAIAVLDPLAPLCWRGVALWPDGLGPALAAAMADPTGPVAGLEELVVAEAVGAWAAARPQRSDVAILRMQARQHRSVLQLRGPGGGLERLAHVLNPLLPCASRLLAGHWVAQLADLLPALEAASGSAELRKQAPIDRHVAAFIGAQTEQRVEGDLAALSDPVSPGMAGIGQMRVLARLQLRLHPAPLPGLADWLAEGLGAAVGLWHSRARRAAIEAKLPELVREGRLPELLAAVDDRAGRAADAESARAARQEAARIDAALHAIATGLPRRTEAGRRLGHEIAAGLGLAALVLVLATAAFG